MGYQSSRLKEKPHIPSPRVGVQSLSQAMTGLWEFDPQNNPKVEEFSLLRVVEEVTSGCVVLVVGAVYQIP